MSAEDIEVREMREGLTKILVAIGRLDEQVKALAQMSNQVQETALKVTGIERDVKTVFIRYDELSRDFTTYKRDNKDDKKWLVGTLFGVIAIALTLLNMVGDGKL